jgi:hypothetical protein
MKKTKITVNATQSSSHSAASKSFKKALTGGALAATAIIAGKKLFPITDHAGLVAHLSNNKALGYAATAMKYAPTAVAFTGGAILGYNAIKYLKNRSNEKSSSQVAGKWVTFGGRHVFIKG